MSTFYESSTFRRNEHDRISTALAGGHDDDTSCCSLSVDCRTPNFQVREGGNPSMKRLCMCYGDDMQYEVKKVSDIRANDYVFAHRSNSSQDPVDMIAIYKACSKALDDGMFVFQPGEFDCGNKYLQAEDLYDPDKPWIEPDRLFPYYFRSNSPITGRITWDEMNSSDFGLRHVFVINTDMDEGLAAKIPDGTIIYIGGDHSREQLGFSSQYQCDSVDWGFPLKMECKMKTPFMKRFSSRSRQPAVSQRVQDDYRQFRNQPSLSFSNWCSTWGSVSEGTTSCVKHAHYKVYRSSLAEVRNAHGSSQVPLSESILNCFKAEAGFSSSDCRSPLKSATKTTRKKKGSYLTAGEMESRLHPAVFQSFGGVGLQLHGESIAVNSGLMNWFMKFLRSQKLMHTSGASSIIIYCSEGHGLHSKGFIVVTKMRLDASSFSMVGYAVLPHGVFKSFTTFITGKNYSETQQIGDQALGGAEMLTGICSTEKSWLSGYFPIHHTLDSGNGSCYLGTASKDIL